MPESGIREQKTRLQNDRKRHDREAIKARRRNAMTLLEFTRICPFRWMKNLYICFYCDEQFADPSLLRQHHSMQHLSQSATQLKLVFTKLKKHELLKVDITDVGCKLCTEEMSSFDELKQHLLLVHIKNLDPKTDEGVLPFRLTKDFQCVLCEAKYDDYKSLNQHMNVHYQNFICEQCGSGFITPDRLRTHSFSHETGAFSCEGCDKVFRSSNAKKEHYALVHMQVKRHRCPHCPEAFRNYFQRSKHVSTVHGVKLKEFKCTMCPKVFLTSGKLRVHINASHLKIKRYSCSFCEWKFYSKTELKDHTVKHGGERKFQCNVCKKYYLRKYTLREHMRIHENDRRFVCTTCGRSFVQKSSLKHHANVQHPASHQARLPGVS